MEKAITATSKKATATITQDVLKTLETALAHHQDNNLKEAEKLYKKALTEGRNQPDIAVLAAIFYQQIGRHKYCLTLLSKALKNNPNHPKAHQLLGKSYLALNSFENAAHHLSAANRLLPGDPQTETLLGKAKLTMGQIKEAALNLQSAYGKKANLGHHEQCELINTLADAYLLSGERAAALTLLKSSIEAKTFNYDTLIRTVLTEGESKPDSLTTILNAYLMDKTRSEAKVLFARFCEYGAVPQQTGEVLKSIIEACLESPLVDHQSIALTWMKHAFETPDQTLKTLYETKTYQAFTDRLQDPKIKTRLEAPFFLQGLKQIRAEKPGLEQFLTHLRRHFLTQLQKAQPFTEGERALLSSLAQQGDLTEYCFNETLEETAAISTLQQELEAISTASELKEAAPEAFLIFASYRPLKRLVNAPTLLQHRTACPALDEVIESQLQTAKQEETLKTRLTTLSAIEDSISQSVRQQYEENPYPRWRRESLFTPPHIAAISPQYLTQKDVLIAGCGTGKQIIAATNLYQNAKITAIDISKASLAYANRKLIEYGKEKDVTLYQCDILDVGKLNRSFDYIECCGVLHHMEDPAKGLTALTALLKTGGKMKLALYSQLARRSVTSARDYIQENGFEPTEADIRACRALLLQQFQTNPAQYPLPAWRDFYSLSECRDLIFHVQEICYNLHELAELIEETGLTFEKFSLPQPVIAAFQNQHPAPEDLANLALWADFEEKNPSTFAGMYQFWVEK